MITKEIFTALILKHQEWSNQVDKVSEVLRMPNLFECDLVEYGATLFDTLIDLLFNTDGADDISWWLYEKAGRSDMKMWDANGKEIPTETIDDLWNLVKDNQK